jgi:hypothetical protein
MVIPSIDKILIIDGDIGILYEVKIQTLPKKLKWLSKLFCDSKRHKCYLKKKKPKKKKEEEKKNMSLKENPLGR